MSDIIVPSCGNEIIDNNPRLINEFGFRNLIFISDKAESPSWSIAITPFGFPKYNSRCSVYNHPLACTIKNQCVHDPVRTIMIQRLSSILLNLPKFKSS